MIQSFRSRALRRYWTKGEAGTVGATWREKIRLILSRLDIADAPHELDLPGFGFHALTGDLAGRYAVTVSHDWRITFAWNEDGAAEIDLEDYHGR